MTPKHGDPFLDAAEEKLLPMMKESAFSFALLSKPDAKLCLEMGAAVLFDKPIIILAPREIPIPLNIQRVASAVVVGNPADPKVQEELRRAITTLRNTDPRMRRKQ